MKNWLLALLFAAFSCYGQVPSGSAQVPVNGSVVAITGGTIDGTVIGATTPVGGTFTNVTSGAVAIAIAGTNIGINVTSSGANVFSVGTTNALVANGTLVQIGSGNAGNAGLIISQSISNAAAIWHTNNTPTASNYSLRIQSATTQLNASSNVILSIANSGILTVGSSSVTSSQSFTAGIGSAITAGGNATSALCMSSTAGFCIYVGSGAPTISAAQGSLYLRSDGSSGSTRAYINSNGSTTWVNITTAS